MADEGRTVIFISHKLHEVKAVSDRVTVLRDGKTVATVDDRRRDAALAGRADGRPRGRRRRGASSAIGEPASRCSRSTTSGPPATAATTRCAASRSTVRAGEIVAVAGVAGNGQRELAEASPACGPPPRGTVHGRRASGCAAATRARRSAPASPTCPRTGCTPASRRASAIAVERRAQVVPRPPRHAGPLLRLGAIREHARRADPALRRPRRRAGSCRRGSSRAATCRRSCSAASSRASRACSSPRRRRAGSTSRRSRPCTRYLRDGARRRASASC